MSQKIYFLFVVLLIYSCSGDSDLSEILTPSTIINLTFPENLSECTEGTIISDTESEITFLWQEVEHVDTYRMTLTNLNNSETQILETKEVQLTVSIKRATPYSWNISSVSKPKKIRSDTWFFYNEGPGAETFVPFPATALSPVSGASISVTSTTVNLRWKAEDLDNDIIGYDLYFGENTDPGLLVSDLENNSYNDIIVTAGKTYYWKIVTKDRLGNESTSPIFNFTVG